MTEHPRVQVHVAGTGRAAARDVLVIVLKFTGLMFILLGLRESGEHLTDGVAMLLDLSRSHVEDEPSFGDTAFRALVTYPANSYFVGMLLLISAEGLAPRLLPDRWWR